MVAGGSTDLVSNPIDSCEVLVAGANSWVYTAALPSSRLGLHGATLNNKILIIGSYKQDT